MRKTLTQKQIRALVVDADRYARLLCLHAAGHRCENEKCSSTYNLEHHHIIGRAHHWSIRLHDLNRMCLCRKCHMWAGSRPIEFSWWLREHDPKRDAFANADHSKPVYNQHDPTARRDELKAQWARIDDE